LIGHFCLLTISQQLYFRKDAIKFPSQEFALAPRLRQGFDEAEARSACPLRQRFSEVCETRPTSPKDEVFGGRALFSNKASGTKKQKEFSGLRKDFLLLKIKTKFFAV